VDKLRLPKSSLSEFPESHVSFIDADASPLTFLEDRCCSRILQDTTIDSLVSRLDTKEVFGSLLNLLLIKNTNPVTF
jgi:hypothetical protein